MTSEWEDSDSSSPSAKENTDSASNTEPERPEDYDCHDSELEDISSEEDSGAKEQYENSDKAHRTSELT